MAIWKVEIFDNPEDTLPSKQGYVEAESADKAADAVIAKLKSDFGKAHLDPVPRINASHAPDGIALWDV